MFAFVTPSSIKTLLKIIFYNCVGIKAKIIQAGYIIYPSPNFHRTESTRLSLSLSLAAPRLRACRIMVMVLKQTGSARDSPDLMVTPGEGAAFSSLADTISK